VHSVPSIDNQKYHSKVFYDHKLTSAWRKVNKGTVESCSDPSYICIGRGDAPKIHAGLIYGDHHSPPLFNESIQMEIITAYRLRLAMTRLT
jgi:hypothetical protein